jgi:tetratricopeptide (TPR) repeat protein
MGRIAVWMTWIRWIGPGVCMTVIIGSGALAQESTAAAAPLPEFQTIAHEMLRVEAESLSRVPDYAVLETLLREARRGIPAAPPFDRADALDILNQIAALLHAHHVRIGDAMLLSHTLTAQTNATPPIYIGDCDTLSFLYLAIGEVLGLPLRLVSLPEHVFVRWEFEDGGYLNWETTANAVWTDADYLDWHNRVHALSLAQEDFHVVARDELLFLVHYNLGNAFTQAHAYDAALTHYTASLAINPDDANAYYQRGQVWYVLDDDGRAIADFSEVLRRYPDDVNARFKRGRSRNELGDYADAITDFDWVLDARPEHADALLERGAAWLLAGEFTTAIADLTRVLALRPDDAEALALRGVAWRDSGRCAQGHDDLIRAAALAPWSAPIANDLAWLLATCPDDAYRDGARAVQHALRAVILEPGARLIYLDTLAAAYAAAGQFEQAVATQRKAIRVIETTANDPGTLRDYQQRLTLYLAGQPYRAGGRAHQ